MRVTYDFPDCFYVDSDNYDDFEQIQKNLDYVLNEQIYRCKVIPAALVEDYDHYQEKKWVAIFTIQEIVDIEKYKTKKFYSNCFWTTVNDSVWDLMRVFCNKKTITKVVEKVTAR